MFCVVHTEIVRFGDKTSRRLSLIICSAAMLTRLLLLILPVLLLLLSIGEPIEEQAGFLSCAVVPVVVILVVQTNETIHFIELTILDSLACSSR